MLIFKKNIFCCILLISLLFVKIVFASPDVVFVGAGPIGLFTAIQAKLLNPAMEIDILEKHLEYERDNELNLHSDSFHASFKDNEAFQQIIHSWGTKARTRQIEEDLRKFATHLGIQIKYQEVTEFQQVRSWYPDVKAIVAADGSHSLMRQHFLNLSKMHTNELKYLVQVKYNTIGKTRHLRLFERFRVVDRTNHPAKETIQSKPEKDKKQVTLNVFIDESEYMQLKAKSSFQKPIRYGSPDFLDSATVSENLRHTIQIWLGGRAYETGEVANARTITLTPVNLVEYFSEQVVFQEDGIDYYLVGDAAFGVPFFRSINNGFKCSNVLSKVLSQYHSSKTVASQITPKDYSQFVKKLEKTEKSQAHLKSSVVSAWKLYVRSWQIGVAVSQVITGDLWSKRYLEAEEQLLHTLENSPSKEGDEEENIEVESPYAQQESPQQQSSKFSFLHDVLLRWF